MSELSPIEMRLKFIIPFLLFLTYHFTLAQQYEYVYRNEKDSSFNCYLKVIPPLKPVKGLVIRDYSSLPDISKASPYQFTQLCVERGLMTIYAVSSKAFPEFFTADSVMDVLDDIVSDVVTKYKIPPNNLFIGGISSSGTRALRYSQYCEQGKSKHGVKIKGVFAVDSPLDLARFYNSVNNHSSHFKAGMLWEANLMHNVFNELFSGAPDQYKSEYIRASVFSHTDSLGGNAYCLKNINLIMYHEPDIDWWLNERGASYLDINSYDIAAFMVKLWALGNTKAQLITTTGKGFDHNGNRNCHSWSIVDEGRLVQWIEELLE